MISGIDASAERFLSGLTRAKDRQARAQREITSGFRINRVSDDPEQVERLIALQNELDRGAQIKINLGLYKAETDAAEKALASAVDVLDKLSVVGAQGATGVITADKRQILANQAEDWLDRLVAISNTSANGRYIFAGDADQQVPYSVDLTQASGVSSYGGAAATRQAEDLSGARFDVSKSADTIFDAPGASVFAAANSLRAALENDDSAAIDAALSALDSARQQLNQQHAEYGTFQNRISAELNAVEARKLQLNEQITGIRETDYAEASIALVTSGTQISAALAARGRQQLPSLFDYLG